MRRFMILALVLSLGCEARRSREGQLAVDEERREYLIAVAIDLSGSYQELMLGGNGKAWQFIGGLINSLSMARAGADDRIIISQISGSKKALLWEGSLQSLRRDFPSAQAFRSFLLGKAEATGSRVHESVGDLVDYITEYPGVKEGKTKSALFILSDMEDNFPDSESTKQRLISSFRSYAKTGGMVGIYWCDSQFCGEWKRHLTEAGFKNVIVESAIVAAPSLPRFEE